MPGGPPTSISHECVRLTWTAPLGDAVRAAANADWMKGVLVAVGLRAVGFTCMLKASWKATGDQGGGAFGGDDGGGVNGGGGGQGGGGDGGGGLG